MLYPFPSAVVISQTGQFYKQQRFMLSHLEDWSPKSSCWHNHAVWRALGETSMPLSYFLVSLAANHSWPSPCISVSSSGTCCSYKDTGHVELDTLQWFCLNLILSTKNLFPKKRSYSQVLRTSTYVLGQHKSTHNKYQVLNLHKLVPLIVRHY